MSSRGGGRQYRAAAPRGRGGRNLTWRATPAVSQQQLGGGQAMEEGEVAGSFPALKGTGRLPLLSIPLVPSSLVTFPASLPPTQVLSQLPLWSYL